MVVYFQPYENFLSKLSDDLRKAGMATHTVDQLYESPSKQDIKSVIAGLKAEIVALQGDKVNLVGSYIDLHTIHLRVQRSLIPIMDKKVLISYLVLLLNLITKQFAIM